MSSISLDDVKKLAKLSALSVSDEEAKDMQAKLAEILGYVEKLDEVDTDGVEPTYAVHGLENITRADQVIDYGVSREELLKNSPAHNGESIEVPRVLE